MILIAGLVFVPIAVAVCIFFVLRRNGAPLAYALPAALVFMHSLLIAAVASFFASTGALDATELIPSAVDIAVSVALAFWLLTKRSRVASWLLMFVELAEIGGLFVAYKAQQSVYVSLNLVAAFVFLGGTVSRLIAVVALLRIGLGWAPRPERQRGTVVPRVFE